MQEDLLLKEKIKQSMSGDVKLRWVIIFLGIIIILLQKKLIPAINNYPIIFILIILTILNIIYYKLLNKSNLYLYSTSVSLDILLVSIAIYYTGGINSPLYLLYFLIILDSSFDVFIGGIYYYLIGAILFSYTVVYLVAESGELTRDGLYNFIVRNLFLIIIGYVGYYTAKEFDRKNKEIEKITEEKEELNIELQKKIKEEEEKLEKKTIELVKKNINLLAEHEIYKGANEAKTKEELLNKILSIIVPLMKGNGGVILLLETTQKNLKIEAIKKMTGVSELKEDIEIPFLKDTILYEIIKEKKTKVIKNIEDIFEKEKKGLDLIIKKGSCIIGPLVIKGEAQGILIVFNNIPNIYDKIDLELMEILGEQIGTLIHNRFLYDEMKNKAEGLEKLMKIIVSMRTLLKSEEIIEKTLNEGIKKLFPFSCGVIMMIDGKSLLIKAEYGYKENLKGKRISLDNFAGWVIKNNRPVLIKNTKLIKFYNEKEDSLYLKNSAILVPIKRQNKNIGIICATKSKDIYTREDLYFLTILANYISSVLETTSLYDDMRRDYINTIYALAAAVDAKDHYTHGHSTTVMKYATKIAERMGIKGEELETIKYAALLHDIGKIGISENIINKPGKLTKEEYNIMKMHPQLGANIISKIDSLKKLVPLILAHHEWVDGNGYPLGLRGNEIPLGARIISVADAYSTMTSKRPYRNPLPREHVIKELKNCSGTQFDSEVVKVMLEILEEEYNKQDIEKEEKKAKRKKRLRINIKDTDEADIEKNEDFYS